MAPMQNRLMVPQRTPLLLDLAPGAAAAFSLRQLSNAYTGPVVTVRRSTDSAEASFTANEIDSGDLAAWCMGGDGFVKQWWDQSGHARHASNSTTAQQPKIVSGGVVILRDGKPAVQFDGSNDTLFTPSFPTKASASAFIVAAASNWSAPGAYRTPLCHAYTTPTQATKGIGFVFIVQVTANDWLLGDVVSFGSGFTGTQYPRSIGPLEAGSDARTVAVFLGPSDASTYVNGAIVPTRVSVAGSIVSVTGPVSVGGHANAQDAWLGTISEAIYYQSIQTPVRDLITGNQMWYY